MQIGRHARNASTERESEREREQVNDYCLCAHCLRNVGISYVHDVICIIMLYNFCRKPNLVLFVSAYILIH